MKFWVLFFALLHGSFLSAQVSGTSLAEKKNQKNSLSIGIYGSTYGSGIKVEYTKQNGSQDFFTDISFGSIRSLKEFKIKSAYSDQNGKDFIWDKRNYLYSLTPVFGFSKELLQRSGYNKIGLRAGAAGGPILGLLKPYYVEIAVPVPPQGAIIDPRPYDATKYTYADIVGEADFFLGMDEIKIVPGIRASSHFIVDFAGAKNAVRAAEVGVFADYFFKAPAILDTGKNNHLFIGASLAVLFGSKW